MSDARVEEIDPLYRAWLLRHELPDAHARWREAASDRAPMFAFTAVACDSKLLPRLGRTGASLAGQAERFAGDVMGKLGASREAQATAQVVRSRVQQWRQRSAAQQTPKDARADAADPAEAPSIVPTLTLSDHLRIALKDQPYYRESTARALFAETLRLGAAGLQVVGAPFDEAIMLATARFAARCCRGLIRGEVPTREECIAAIGLVQQWGVRASKNPFTVDLTEASGAAEDLVLGLARDVGTCLAIAAHSCGGPLAPGFVLWEEAEEYLAFAVLSLSPNRLSGMNIEQARAFAGAAARLADRAMRDPSVRVPVFPESLGAGGPRMVLASTRFALPDGADPRRSALAVAAAA